MNENGVKVKGVADLVFVVDCSASMNDIIDALKQYIADFVNLLLNDPQSTVSDVRLGLVTHAGGGLISHGFLPSVDEFCQKLADSPGGGDEAGLPAVDFALDMPWRPLCRRYVVFFSDEAVADGAEPERQVSKLHDLCRKMAALHVKFIGFNEKTCPSYSLLGKVPGSSFSVLTRQQLIGPGMQDLLKGLGATVSAAVDVQGSQTTSLPRNLYGIESGSGDFRSQDGACSGKRICLQEPGSQAQLALNSSGISSAHVQMKWTSAIDLDLHAFYETLDGEKGQVYFGDKGNLNGDPFIGLDYDAGVGDRSGKNEENLQISRVENFARVLLCTNIYDHPLSKFAKYNGRIELTTDNGDCIEVPLTSDVRGSWCIIAEIKGDGQSASLINVNTVQMSEPSV